MRDMFPMILCDLGVGFFAVSAEYVGAIGRRRRAAPSCVPELVARVDLRPCIDEADAQRMRVAAHV